MAISNQSKQRTDSRSLKAFNKWFDESDLPGSHRASAYEGWAKGEARARSAAGRSRAKLEKALDESGSQRERDQRILKQTRRKVATLQAKVREFANG